MSKLKDAAGAAAPAILCAQCGATMVAQPVLDEREIVKGMITNGSQHHYAANFAATVHEKQAAAGVVHQCPVCRYVTRVKDAA